MMGSLFRLLFVGVLAIVLAFGAVVWLNTPTGDTPLTERMTALAKERMQDDVLAFLAWTKTLSPDSAETVPASRMDEATGSSALRPGPSLAPADVAALTEVIRAEFRAESEAQSRAQFWQDVALSAAFMLFGGLFGEVGRLFGLRR